MQRKRISAFTLIELLVVISVIALLMAILMPALQKARKLTQSAVCKAHLRQWGPGPIMVNHQFGPDVSKNYGSYGTNLWINSVERPSTMGWREQPERQWKKLQSKYAADIPMVSDCTWFGTNPISLNDSSWPNGGDPAPSENWWQRQDPINFNQWGWDMARLTINRHSRGINMTFMDGSTRKMILNDLWDLKWHKGYERVCNVKIPWLK